MLFAVLRDGRSTCQLRWSRSDAEASSCLDDFETFSSSTPLESVVRVDGVVALRPKGQRRTTSRNASIEIVVDSFRVLNRADSSTMPFNQAEISGGVSHGEDLLLKHRYLHLRTFELQRNLAVRSAVTSAARSCLLGGDDGSGSEDDDDTTTATTSASAFTEIETPTLFKSTPEGAREFLVPTRSRGRFYALVQSPQQYKQLLMSGAVDRYVQFARCYRDESGRADRQPEFTQIDMELAFASAEDVMSLVERTVAAMWRSAAAEAESWKHEAPLATLSGPPPATPMRRMSYADAMARYGSDKPDVRFGMEIESTSRNFRAFRAPSLASECSRKSLETLVARWTGVLRDEMRLDDDVELVVASVSSSSTSLRWHTRPPAASDRASVEEAFASSASPGTVVVGCRGSTKSSSSDDVVSKALGRLRLECSRDMHACGLLEKELRPDNFQFLWITDFPLFEKSDVDGDGGLVATHHPFTAPVGVFDEHDAESWTDRLSRLSPEELLAIRGQHYDLVVNGMEIAGGSIRMHSPSMQQAVLRDVLKLPDVQLRSFDHLLRALSHGCPPHGGIALGLDRFVSALCGAASIREVIAFPKSATGNELMTDSPSSALPKQLGEYHIGVLGGSGE